MSISTEYGNRPKEFIFWGDTQRKTMNCLFMSTHFQKYNCVTIQAKNHI